jgi:hypothetical protein
MDFVADSLEVLSQLCLLFHFISIESIWILFLSDFLLFISNFERSQVLFELSLVDPVLVFNILDSDLRLLFQLCQLIQVLEEQVLCFLSVYFLLDLMTLLQIM